MKQLDPQMFQTPIKIKPSVETSEEYEMIVSPAKSSKPDLYDQILGESLSHSQPFFSERCFKIDDHYEFSHFDYDSSQSEDSVSIQMPEQKICLTVKKNTGINIDNLQVNTTSMIKTNKKGCNCDKSKCQKQYCVCLKNGDTCSSDCQCIDCENTIITSKHLNNKKKAAEIKQNMIQKGCNCKNSNCKQGYCFCHSNGRKCSKYCRCIDCFNVKESQNQDQDRQNQDCVLTTKKRINISEFNTTQNKQNIKVNS